MQSNGLNISLHAQSTTTYPVPLVYGRQADPMMVYWNSYYYLYVDDRLGYDRMRKSKCLAGLASAESEVVYAGSRGVDASVSCAYIFEWSSHWYQYCGDSTGPLVLERSTSDPMSTYTLAGRLDLAGKVKRVDELLPKVFARARGMHPVQPLTSRVWVGDSTHPESESATTKIQLTGSDSWQ